MSNTKYYMVTREFDTPIYISATPDGNLPGVTTEESEAAKWDERDGISDNSTKLKYHQFVTGYDGLKFEPIN